uniref:Sulfotransferase n=1 Tax=Ciona savignyi TaxID=51511 RepID=H2ZBZ5_CIOSA
MLGAVFPFLYYFNKNYDVTFRGKLQDIKPDSRFTKELSDDTRAANHVESNAKYDVIDSQMQDEHAEKPIISDVTKATTKPAISEYLLNRPRLWAELVASGNTSVKRKQLPRLIGIGVEKCGTHAFLHFIKPHPLIKVMHNIEAHFFDERSNQPISNYLAMMPEVGPNDFVMEKTPAYFSFPPYQIPRLIKTHVPQAKIVLILCEPAKRVYSDFVHEWAWHNISHNWSGIDKFATIQDYLKVYLPKMSSAFLPYNESTSSL